MVISSVFGAINPIRGPLEDKLRYLISVVSFVPFVLPTSL